MVFSSLTFLYLFFPICVLFYALSPSTRAKNWVLACFSLVFYAWGEPVMVGVLIASVFLNYHFGKGIEKGRGSGKSRALLVASLVYNIGVLFMFKYTGFVVQNLNGAFSMALPVPGWGLPIGISFYTFQLISYLVDVYWGKVNAQKSRLNFMLYVSLFPQLVAGPILRYTDVVGQIENRNMNPRLFAQGVTRFMVGLGKKLLLANQLGELSATLLDGNLAQLPVAGAWLGLLCFALQIYFDFSGYSDMAVGMGNIFGFDYQGNFNYPYISKSISEFWRRWHISLGLFFRDYVYIPLGGNRRYALRNLMVVWALTGLWHGASWNFIFWGLYFGLWVVAEKTILKGVMKKCPPIISMPLTFLMILFGWALFYYTDATRLFDFIKVLFGVAAVPLTSPQVTAMVWNNLFLLIAAALACVPLGVWVKRGMERLWAMGSGSRVLALGVTMLFNLAILAVCTAMLIGSSYNPFLYFRF